MNLKLRAIEEREEAHGLAGLLEESASQSSRAWRDDPLPEGFGRSFLERNLGRPETLFLVAEAADAAGNAPAALCVTGPFEDPLTGEVTPLIVVLWVDPDLRHRGVARALVAEAGRLLAARGLSTLAARAAHNDDALISMGERWGFVRDWEWMERER